MNILDGRMNRSMCLTGYGALRAVIVLASLVSAPWACASASPVVARVEGGLVRGRTEHGVIAFEGIPFAAPPVGALRWAPPQAVRPWKGVRPALTYAHDCMQIPLPGDLAPGRTVPDENCLYVNVWRPRRASAHNLPVMVWIYGGGFVNGGTSPAVYDGTPFARDGVVLVSFNYRLGNFGFFGFPALTREGRGELLGDYTFMDQLAALKWVQRNIRAFGGDPHNVTIFGESAGGISVNTLLITPLAHGLFQRAIIESGGGRAIFPERPLTGSPRSADAMGVRLARHFGIDGEGLHALGQLRALPASTLVDGLNMATMTKSATYVGGPIQYDHLYMGDPIEVYARQPQIGNRVPVMIGDNSADIGFFPAKSVKALFARFGPKAAAARAAFDPTGRLSVQEVSLRIGGTLWMLEPARAIARMLSARGQPVYEYRFSYVATSLRGTPFGKPGAMHATEIPFVFDTVKAHYGSKTSQADETMAREMHAYWVAFAKFGRPDPAGLPPWPQYHARTDRLMNFTAHHGPVAEADPWKTRLDLAEWYSDRQEGIRARPQTARTTH
jgi:para-nitrobenzyl esterase